MTEHAAANVVGDKPVPFMQLPKDVRLMVYERLPRTVKHVRIGTCGHQNPAHTNTDTTTILVTRSTSTMILATCREVYDEASSIVQKTIEQWVLKGGVKLVWTIDSGVHVNMSLVLWAVLLRLWEILKQKETSPTSDKLGFPDLVEAQKYVYSEETSSFFPQPTGSKLQEMYDAELQQSFLRAQYRIFKRPMRWQDETDGLVSYTSFHENNRAVLSFIDKAARCLFHTMAMQLDSSNARNTIKVILRLQRHPLLVTSWDMFHMYLDNLDGIKDLVQLYGKLGVTLCCAGGIGRDLPLRTGTAPYHVDAEPDPDASDEGLMTIRGLEGVVDLLPPMHSSEWDAEWLE
jgi:hypothetical protein